MEYKKGDRYKYTSEGGTFVYIYEYIGFKDQLVIVESNSIAFPVGCKSNWVCGRDEYLGNFSKSDNFCTIYDILNS